MFFGLETLEIAIEILAATTGLQFVTQKVRLLGERVRRIKETLVHEGRLVGLDPQSHFPRGMQSLPALLRFDVPCWLKWTPTLGQLVFQTG
jgi:hypothetical protein